MLDSEIELTGEQPQKAAHKPTAGEARVERQCTVDQPDHGADIFAETRQHKGGDDENARVVLSDLECLPSKLDAAAAEFLRFCGPAVIDKPHVAVRHPGKCRAKLPIYGNRPLKKSQRLDNAFLCYRKIDRKRAQIEIISVEVGSR